MNKIILRGLPEGLVGRSEITFNSFEELFINYPQLIRFKSQIESGASIIESFDSCDG